jgi:N-acetylglucosaminyldiphosphoundecaprenol N-acetyl-beta-D-mannosaminyltransferase
MGEWENGRMGEWENGRMEASSRGDWDSGSMDSVPDPDSSTPPLSHSPDPPFSHSPDSPFSHSPTPPFSHSPAPPLSHSSSPFPRVTVIGIKVDNVSEDEALSLIDGWVDGGAPAYMAVVNAAKLVSARRHDQLRRALLSAGLVTADGMSVVWASRLLGSPLKERVTGIDMFERLIGHAARRGASVYLMGGRDEAVDGTVNRFTREYPELKVAGYRNGYFDAAETGAVVEQIRQSGAELLFVAMGSPMQEIFIASNLEATGARFALGVGGAFDHLSGLSRRAPVWMQRAGLEWLYRLLSEPRRLWRRYLIGNLLFTCLLAKQLVSRSR